MTIWAPGAVVADAARSYHKGNVAQDLLEAAARILDSERVEDLSVRRLARVVGVTPANFYNHFDDLNDLLLNLGADAFEARARLLADIRRTSKSRSEAIRRSVTSYVDLASQTHQVFRIMFGLIPNADRHPRFQRASEASMGELVELVYGEPRHDPSNLDASRDRCKAAYAILALGYGLARVIVDGSVPFSAARQADMRAFVEAVIQTVLDGELAALAADPEVRLEEPPVAPPISTMFTSP